MICLCSSFQKDIPKEDLVEVGGRISSVDVVGKRNSHIRTAFDGNSNQYETHISRFSDAKLQQLKRELKTGELVFVRVGRESVRAVDSPYVATYGIRTENKSYLSIDEYNQSESEGRVIGYAVGIIISGAGLLYVLSGRIDANQDRVASSR